MATTFRKSHLLMREHNYSAIDYSIRRAVYACSKPGQPSIHTHRHTQSEKGRQRLRDTNTKRKRREADEQERQLYNVVGRSSLCLAGCSATSVHWGHRKLYRLAAEWVYAERTLHTACSQNSVDYGIFAGLSHNTTWNLPRQNPN